MYQENNDFFSSYWGSCAVSNEVYKMGKCIDAGGIECSPVYCCAKFTNVCFDYEGNVTSII